MHLKIISQFHPGACLHNPRLWADMLGDWEHLPEQVPHDFKLVPKGFINASEYSMDTENTPAGKLGDWSIAYRNEAKELCVMPFTGANPHMVFGGRCIMQNAKWDIHVLKKAGMNPPTDVHDTMIAAYCLGLGKQAPKDSTKKQSGSEMVGGLGLKYLARRHLGMTMKTWHEVYDKPELVPEYNANDSVATYLLWEKWKSILPWHYWNIDMPLLPVLMAIEDRGIPVDPNFLREYAAHLDERLAEFDLPFNPFATQEVQSYVYGALEIEPWRFTDTGAPSTDADVLENIDDPLVKQLIEYKQIYQERNTYTKGYMKGLDSDNRLHTELKQTSTATGRLSSANPNLQNVIKEGDMRKLFIAPPGMKLVRLDYDQLEWRVLAAITQDPILLKALASGKKIHQVTSEQMNITYAKAKTGNFAIQYGAKAWTLSQNLECTIEEAKQFMVLYFKKFPGVKKYQDQQREIANNEKKVTNYFGRVRRLDAMYSSEWRIRQEGEKEAINTPIQGAAGEIVKLAMIDLHNKHKAPMLLQVHDELLFEVPKKEAEDYAQWLREYVPTITKINGIQFPVDVSVGDNWAEVSK